MCSNIFSSFPRRTLLFIYSLMWHKKVEFYCEWYINDYFLLPLNVFNVFGETSKWTYMFYFTHTNRRIILNRTNIFKNHPLVLDWLISISMYDLTDNTIWELCSQCKRGVLTKYLSSIQHNARARQNGLCVWSTLWDEFSVLKKYVYTTIYNAKAIYLCGIFHSLYLVRCSCSNSYLHTSLSRQQDWGSWTIGQLRHRLSVVRCSNYVFPLWIGRFPKNWVYSNINYRGYYLLKSFC